MSLTRRTRLALVGLGAAGLLAALLIFAPSIVARRLIVHYFDQAGVATHFGDVGFNVFTGTLDVSDAHGRSGDGDGFDIGHLLVNLQYLPLLSHQLSFYRIVLSDSRIDIRRTGNNALRVAGVTVLPSGQSKNTGYRWGLGLQRLRLDTLRLDYSQPGAHGAPEIKRSLVFNQSSANNVVTWRPHASAPVDANIASGNSHLHLKGQVKPFGRGMTASLDLQTKDFALDLIAPITAHGGVQRLTGTLDCKVHIDLGYNADSALTIKISGPAEWHDSRLRNASGLVSASKLATWQGNMDLNLLRANKQPDQINTDGKLHIDGLALSQSQGPSLRQSSTDWQGTSSLSLAGDASRFVSQGRLTARNTHAALPDALDFDAGALDWRGKTTLWPERSLARRLKGGLDATNAKLTLAAAPLAITAGEIKFNGLYQQRPKAGGATLGLQANGQLNGQAVRVNNTKVGAYWATAEKLQAKNLVIKSTDAIAIDTLHTRHLRLFQSPAEAGGAVVNADTADADKLALDHLHAYHIGDLNIEGADLVLQRNRQGVVPFMRFFAGGNGQTRTTLAIDDARLGHASEVHLRDASVDPPVALKLGKTAAVLKNLNTAVAGQFMDYRLSAGLGQYGHIDSTGRIAPLAADGANLSLKARIRSLALPPLSGYLNAALQRGIASGVGDGDLDLKARHGQLDGHLDVTLSNFHLANGASKETEVALGVSLDTAIDLLRKQDNTIAFSTAILGDFSRPAFSIDNLVREAIFAGLRAAVTSVYSPLGLLNIAKNKLLNIGRALSFHPIAFKAGRHYLPAQARSYLATVATAMSKQPGLRLTLTGHAVSEDGSNPGKLQKLARARAKAVRDYLAARQIAGNRLTLAEAVVDRQKTAKPRVTMSLADLQSAP